MKKTSIYILFDHDITFKDLLKLRNEYQIRDFTPLIEYLEAGYEFDQIMDMADLLYTDLNFAVGLNYGDILEVECLQSDSVIGRLFISCLGQDGHALRLVQKRFLDKDTLDLYFDWYNDDLIDNPVERDLGIIKEKINLLLDKKPNIDKWNW